MIEKRTSVIYSIYRARIVVLIALTVVVASPSLSERSVASARIAVPIALTVAVASLSFVVGEEGNF